MSVAPGWLNEAMRISRANPEVAELDEWVTEQLAPSCGFGNRGAVGRLARDD